VSPTSAVAFWSVRPYTPDNVSQDGTARVRLTIRQPDYRAVADRPKEEPMDNTSIALLLLAGLAMALYIMRRRSRQGKRTPKF